MLSAKMFKMKEIGRLCESLRGCLMTRIQCIKKSSTKTSSDQSNVEKTAMDTTEEENKNSAFFEVPKPFLDIQSGRNLPRMKIRQYLANWSNDQESGQDWSQTWNAPSPFDPHKVPLDIRMGRPQKKIPQPYKYSNTELAKVQNFLHLTPPTIQKHCQNLKKFCTKWPEELKTDEDCERLFPVEVLTTDYLRAGPYQRNPDARTNTLKIRLCNLVLDNHARVKLIKLAGKRYEPKSDVLTIKAYRCPVRKQNREYLDYLLTVLYYESWKTEKWETKENIVDEDGIYWWKDSISYNNMIRILKCHSDYKSLFSEDEDGSDVHESLGKKSEVKSYHDAVVNIKVPDQNITGKGKLDAILRYKESVRTLLKLPQLQ